MNFVGSEVDLATGTITRPVAMVSPSSTTGGSSINDDDRGSCDNEDDDLHPTVSPHTGAEHLFLHGLEAQQISAYALAQQIHRQLRFDATAGTATVATEDYATAYGGSSVASFPESTPTHQSSSHHNHTSSYLAATTEPSHSAFDFGRDALAHTRNDLPYSQSSSPYSDNNDQRFYDANTMSNDTTTTTTPKPDAAEKVYDAAKSAWGWGKSVAILSPFLGLAETVATKAVALAGTDLTTLDTSINTQLESLDGKYLNPAIAALVAALVGTATKSEELLKPLLQALLHPVQLIQGSSNSTTTTTKPGGEAEGNPEVTIPPPTIAVK